MDKTINNQSQDNLINTRVMDLINIISLIIGLQNLELNVTANDLDNVTNKILKEIHTHLDRLDEHLKIQDEHLLMQDDRLDEEDLRLYRLEKMLDEAQKRRIYEE